MIRQYIITEEVRLAAEAIDLPIAVFMDLPECYTKERTK